MFSFCTNSRLIAKKTNTSAVVIGCRENTQLYKSFDMHFNLDNKEYSLTLEKYREENKKAKERIALRHASNRSFCNKMQLDY